jgi:hypothetical protein
MPITVGIAGITGKFARLIANNLCKSPNVHIRGFCRNESKLPKHFRESSRVTVLEGNATDLVSLRQFARGCDVVICCYLGDNELMTNGQKLLVDACELEGVSRYIASDYCLDFTKLELGQHPAKDPMKHVKAHLDTKQTVKGVHILIGVFMETFWSGYFGIWDEKSCRLKYYGNGDEMWESTTYDTAAEFVAAVAQDRNAVGTQHCEIMSTYSFTATQITKHIHVKQSWVTVVQSVTSLKTSPKFMAHGQSSTASDRSMISTRRCRQSSIRTRQTCSPILLCECSSSGCNAIESTLMLIGFRFYQYYCTNGQTYLKKQLDNSKYPQITPVTFKDFLQAHKMEDLADAYNNAGSSV